MKRDGYRGIANLLWSDPDCTTILSSTPFSCKGLAFWVFWVPSRMNQEPSGIVVADVAHRGSVEAEAGCQVFVVPGIGWMPKIRGARPRFQTARQ